MWYYKDEPPQAGVPHTREYTIPHKSGFRAVKKRIRRGMYKDKSIIARKKYLETDAPDGLILRSKREKDKFRLSITDFAHQDSWAKYWCTTLKHLYDLFAEKAPHLLLKMKFIYDRDDLEFHIGKFTRDRAHASWEGSLLKKYNGWYYIEFREFYDSLRCPEMTARLTQLDIHPCDDWDWTSCMMFFKSITARNILFAISRHRILCQANCEVNEYVNTVQKRFLEAERPWRKI